MSISSKSKELLFTGNQTSGTKRTQRSWDEDSLDTHATWASSNSEDLAQPQIRRRLDSNTSNADGTTRSSSYQEHNQKTLTEVSELTALQSDFSTNPNSQSNPIASLVEAGFGPVATVQFTPQYQDNPFSTQSLVPRAPCFANHTLDDPLNRESNLTAAVFPFSTQSLVPRAPCFANHTLDDPLTQKSNLTAADFPSYNVSGSLSQNSGLAMADSASYNTSESLSHASGQRAQTLNTYTIDDPLSQASELTASLITEYAMNEHSYQSSVAAGQFFQQKTIDQPEMI